MRSSRKTRVVLPALVALLAMVSACSRSTAGPEGASPALANPPATVGDSPVTIASPIAKFLGYDQAPLTDPTAAEARFAQQDKARQDAIAACMKDQGFTYVPVATEASATSDGGLEYGTEAWVARYGFGISTLRWPQSAVGPDLIGYDDTASGFTGDDPNQDIVDGLTPPEQQAYYAALYGQSSSEPPPEASPTTSPGTTAAIAATGASPTTAGAPPTTTPALAPVGGCQGRAEGSIDDLSVKFYEQFQGELNTMYDQAQKDPRIVEADETVADCVATKGLAYAGSEEVYNQFDEQLHAVDELVGPPDAIVAPTSADAAVPGAAAGGTAVTGATPDGAADSISDPDGEGDGQGDEPIVLGPEARTKLAEVQRSEIALALAVDDCGGGYRQQRTLLQQVLADYEQQYLDANRDRIVAFKAQG